MTRIQLDGVSIEVPDKAPSPMTPMQVQEVLLFSIANSLKRIADALHGDEQNSGIKHMIGDFVDHQFRQ